MKVHAILVNKESFSSLKTLNLITEVNLIVIIVEGARWQKEESAECSRGAVSLTRRTFFGDNAFG